MISSEREVQEIVQRELGKAFPKLVEAIAEACLAAMFLKLGLIKELPEGLQYIEVSNTHIIETLVKSPQGSIEYFIGDAWCSLFPHEYVEGNNFIRCTIVPTGNEVCISNGCSSFRTKIRA